MANRVSICASRAGYILDRASGGARLSRNGSIMLSRPFNERLKISREFKNNRNAMPGTTAKTHRARRITTFHEVIE